MYALCRCSVKVLLKVDQVTVTRTKECGGDLSFPFQRERLIQTLKHQVSIAHPTSVAAQ